ncbi:hypothetical protein RYX45_22400, partial [Alkalihalophilus pseudofirmus]
HQIRGESCADHHPQIMCTCTQTSHLQNQITHTTHLVCVALGQEKRVEERGRIEKQTAPNDISEVSDRF